LRIRRNRRARRLILRLDADGEGVVVTLPPGATPDQALALVADKAGWIARRMAEQAPRVRFTEGARVPLLGVPHRVRHVAGAGAPVRSDAGEILVGGRPEHLARRLGDWLRAEARRQIAPRAEAKAKHLGRRIGRITVREARSRWGSCSADGSLSFCWRLVMAPERVLDYVVAHEVAHLAESGHGPAFWATVAGLTDGVEAARQWLRRHGPALHRYG
jgi:predicted metal-dependent hydrolase